ncbi:RHS repeat-associated protein [Kineothrix alysoides]|uniref:RHS repeat-associated protein n=1 Tax=Kineothrix alysoides TaxID=1469948 RepID=A0A4R1R6P8_9FIRM|nr:DUF6531 domain-containing protein [Kineothrix alysoides]TCL60982.1 RHS repeat-associated protein [Kineothrix alysoides]
MSTLERNRVFELQALEEFQEGSIKALAEAERISAELDGHMRTVAGLIGQVPGECREPSFSGSMGAVPGTFVYEAYATARTRVDQAVGRLSAEIPQKDGLAAGLQQEAKGKMVRCAGMIQGLEDLIDAGALSLGYEEFTKALEDYKGKWEEAEAGKEIDEERALELLGFADYSVLTGDPVNILTGNFVFRETALYIGGRYPLSFAYSYNSLSTKKGSMGRSFVHTMELRLEQNGDSVSFWGPEGNRKRFRQSPEGYRREDGVLLREEGGLRYKDNGPVQYVFGADGRCLRQEDMYGRGASLSYDGEGRLCRMETDTGEALDYRYEEERLVRVEDHTGRGVDLVYEEGRLVQVVDPMGHGLCYGYGSNNRITRVLDRTGALQVENTYDAGRRVLEQRFGDGTRIHYEYTEGKNRRVVTGRDGRRTVFLYDSQGRLIASQEESGEKKKDIFSFEQKPEDPRTQELPGIVRDEEGNIIQLQRTGEGADRLRYDERGNVVELELAEGIRFRYAYDAWNRVKERTDGRGYTTGYRYDGNGRLLEVRHPDGTERSYRYDGNGRLIARRLEDGQERKFTYNAEGLLCRVQEETGEEIAIGYDLQGRPVEFLRADGSRIRYGYEEDGEIRVEDSRPEGPGTGGYRPVLPAPPVYDGEAVCTYDEAGNVTGRELPDGTSFRYAYDSRNRLIRVTDGEGNTFRYGYDPLGRCQWKQDPMGAQTRYTYDARGRLTSVQDAHGTVTDVSGFTGEWEEGLPEEGEPLSLTLPGITEERDQAGRLLLRRYPGGIRSSYAYDACGRIARILHEDDRGIIEELGYGYDGNGSCIRVEKARKGCEEDSGEYRYAYDALGRLTESRKDGKVLRRYRYDARGNRLEMESEEEKILYRYDGEGKLLRIESSEGAAACKGGPHLEGALRYRRLASGGGLIEEETGKGTRRYFYSGLPQGYVEEDGTVHYFLTDHLGSVLRVCSAQGKTESVCAYDEFGVVKEGEAGPVGFAGYLAEGDGTFRTRGRRYDPAAGRFLSPDPWPGNPGNPQTMNRYVYVLNRPLNLTDATGAYPETGRERLTFQMTLSPQPQPAFSYADYPALEPDYFKNKMAEQSARAQALGNKIHYEVDKTETNQETWIEKLDRYVDELMDSATGNVLTMLCAANNVNPVTGLLAAGYMAFSGRSLKEASADVTSFLHGLTGGLLKASGETMRRITYTEDAIAEISKEIREHGVLETGKAMLSGIGDSLRTAWEEDLINGTAKSRGELAGRLAGTILTAVPGVGAVMGRKAVNKMIDNAVDRVSNDLNHAFNFAQDVFGKITDAYYPRSNNNATREKHKKTNDTLSLSQFPGALTYDMYIKNQNKLGGEDGYLYANTNASDMGCGAVAVYNALHAVGADVSFNDALYGTDIGTVGGGANIIVMGEYMEDQGYEVTYLFGDEIDEKSGNYDAIIVTSTDIKFEGHYYTMIPTGTQNQNGENIYHFYNGFGDYINAVGSYEEGVNVPGEQRGLNIHVALAIQKKEQ